MRQCSVCKEEKGLDQYHRVKSFPLGRAYTCKPCARHRSREWNKANKERKKANGKRHYTENKEDYLDRAVAKYEREKGCPIAAAKRRATHRRWREKNPGKACRHSARRRSKYAQPPWLSEEQILEIERIYTACSRVTQRTQISHHVDHIVPLNGKNVCGLHVPWNLRIIPAKMNLSKGNSYPESY